MSPLTLLKKILKAKNIQYKPKNEIETMPETGV
jgi:hypothetical protein